MRATGISPTRQRYGRSNGGGGGGAPVYNPNVLAWNGSWPASYTSPTWTGQASAGTSSGRNLTNAAAPANGTAIVTGKVPADFNGTTQLLTSADTPVSYVTKLAGTIVCLFKADTAVADTAAYYNLPALVSDTPNGYMAMGFGAGGVRFGSYDVNTGAFNSILKACSTGAYHVAIARWAAGVTELSVDFGAFSTMAQGVEMDGTGSINVGANLNSGAKFDGTIGELRMGPFRISDASIASYRTYINGTYSLSL